MEDFTSRRFVVENAREKTAAKLVGFSQIVGRL